MIRAFFQKIFASPTTDPSLCAEAQTALDAYDALLTGYLNHTKAQTWKTTYTVLAKCIEQAGYGKYFWSKKEAAIDRFLQRYRYIDTARHIHNHSFIETELQQQTHLFSNIEGKHDLDAQQRRAVVTDEDNNLVIAGAGSGKTMTIAAKVRYLMTRYGVEPQKILLLSFTQMAKKEMEERVIKSTGKAFDVMTFHGLGLRIIEQATQKKCSIAIHNVLGDVVEQSFEKHQKDPQYLQLLQTYFAYYLHHYQPESTFDKRGEYILYFRDKHFSIKHLFHGKKSLQKELLKSMEEVEIANFLFMQNIEYHYEYPYQHPTADLTRRQYKPDFYLPQYGIYIEHFALDEDGNCPAWFKPSYKDGKTYTYQDGVQWKRALHQEYGTPLIETYSYQKRQGTLITNLAQQLQAKGVDLSHPKSTAEVWEAIKKHEELLVTRFSDLLYTFMLMLKCNNLSLPEVILRNERLSGYEHDRNHYFLQLFAPVYQDHCQYLNDRQEIDFNDMINHAIPCVKNGSFKNPYDYIIIDEFQDISGARSDLIKALKASNPHCKLFCVGDDWQSIYRFAGSDISLFTDFETYFGVTEKLFIETTYRFDESMIALSNWFVLQNPRQIPKKMRSTNGKKTIEPAYQIIYSTNAADALAQALDDIIQRHKAVQTNNNPAAPKIMVIGRTKFDNNNWKQIQGDTTRFEVSSEEGELNNRKITYLPHRDYDILFITAHSTKGLQADYVVVLNGADGKFDFPSQVQDDRVMQLLMRKSENFPFAEERRLFYVAMTRAKKRTYFVSRQDKPSVFIREIAPYCPQPPRSEQALLCPNCQVGRIVQRESKGQIFYGCTLYPHCDQTMTAHYYEKMRDYSNTTK